MPSRQKCTSAVPPAPARDPRDVAVEIAEEIKRFRLQLAERVELAQALYPYRPHLWTPEGWLWSTLNDTYFELRDESECPGDGTLQAMERRLIEAARMTHEEVRKLEADSGD